MPADPFVHLHAASGYSLRYGAAAPHVLVERAAEQGMDALALTDRDGLYGAVKFALACRAAGIRPLFGVDLAVTPAGSVPADSVPAGSRPPGRRVPARGGATVDPRHPRVTVLATGPAGWPALCRLVSATHLRGERGRPVSTLESIAEHAAGEGLLVLLGPSSQVGRALAARRPDLARAELRRWRAAVPAGLVVVEVVSHRGAGDTARAARLLGLATEERLPVVLTNAVRYVDPGDAPLADVLDATRRLVPLDARHVDRTSAEGYLKTGKEMRLVAEEVTAAAGLGPGAAAGLLAATRRVTDRCVVDPRRDVGLGGLHFPELAVLDGSGRPAEVVLRERCEAGLGRRGMAPTPPVRQRLDEELAVIGQLGYPSYFLTVADVVQLVREMGVRVAARGSGAGSLVTYLLGISGVDPLRHGLVMERFLSPLRQALPDIDLDVESARRTEVYQQILAQFGGARCTCVSMMDTYRARHAIRDVGAALGLPPGEIDAVAKSFPHIRARDVRAALRELPELAGLAGLAGRAGTHDLLLRLVERLDGLPRHVALHPCGVLLSDATLLDRTPVEASWLGFPMSQFDKDDVEHLGLLKLDVLGVRMQSAMAHAVSEVARVDGVAVDLDAVPTDDPATFRLIQSTRTLGCFQIESPGQRELVGKFAPETFEDLVVDISLFRPGPVKSDMVVPFLRARQGWASPRFVHEDLRPVLAETFGVVVFHEQVLRVVAVLTGCSLAEADEARRALGDAAGQEELRVWFFPRALARGYPLPVVEEVWEVLRSFASFGFCKAHAAAFALPTYQSAWLKAHHPAAFLAGVLTHDPGMYPKRLILDDARQFGVAVLPLDVNRSDGEYRVERVGTLDEPPPEILDGPPRPAPDPGLPDGRAYGIRLGLVDVKGLGDAELHRIVAGRPYGSLADFWHRARVSRPVVERLVLAGAFDALYGIGAPAPVRRRGQVTRRDLLLQVAELDRWRRAVDRGRARAGARPAAGPDPGGDVRALAARQSAAPRAAPPPGAVPVQLTLDLADAPDAVVPSGLPEMTGAERVCAELEVLGLDVTRHVVDFYGPFLDALGVTRSRDLLRQRSDAELLVAGVKVATQTPPVRSGRRVVFVTLDDATGPVDATFFEDAQGPYAATLFHGWLLLVRGHLRRTGPRGVSLRATGCWELPVLHATWELGGLAPVVELLGAPPASAGPSGTGRHRVLVHPSGFRQSPYADVRPAGGGPRDAARAGPPRKLWHASPGSAGG